MPADPTVCVIVPVHNGGAKFRRCLDALLAAEPPPQEIIIVSDCGTDGSAEYAAERGLKVLHTPMRSGPAAARNLGIRATSCEVVFFVDADVAIHRDTVGGVRAFLREHPEYAGLMGNYDDAPPEPNFLSQYKNLMQHYVHRHASREAKTFWGACGAMRREVFLQLNGFDEEYDIPCIEDIELGMRATRSGHRLALVPEIEVTHLKRWTVKSLFVSDFFRRALPWMELISRGEGLSDDLNTDRSTRLKVALVGLLPALALMSILFPKLLAGLAACALLILALDARMLSWFAAKRGFTFLPRLIAWQWFYYFYCGVAFAVGTARHHLFRSPVAERTPAT